jgi:hypothetical protein
MDEDILVFLGSKDFLKGDIVFPGIWSGASGVFSHPLRFISVALTLPYPEASKPFFTEQKNQKLLLATKRYVALARATYKRACRHSHSDRTCGFYFSWLEFSKNSRT